MRALRAASTFLFVALAVALCFEPLRVSGAGLPQPAANDMIRVGPDGWTFVDGRGNRFTPFGCTYHDPQTWLPEKRGERWDAGKTGPAVIDQFDPVRTDRHFQLLSDTAQASVVRVFLSPAVFMPQMGKFDDIAFKRLDKMLELAAQRNIRLILDVAEVWEGQAPWMIADGLVDLHANDTALQGLSLFAAELGRRYRNNSTIFAWNLQNEPFILGADSPFIRGKWRAWLKERYGSADALKAAWSDFPQAGEAWPDWINAPDIGADSPGDPRLYDFQLFREYVATRWTARLSRALRSTDPNHLVTIGLIQFSSPIRDGKVWGWSYPGISPQALTPYVDFMSIHGYVWNYEDRFDYIPGVLRYAYAGKPVVLEEFRYDDSVIDATVGSASGWLSWWCFDDPVEKPGESIFDLDGNLTKEGQRFRQKALDLYGRSSLARKSGDVALGVDRKLLLTSGAERDKYYSMYVSESKQRPVDFQVPTSGKNPDWQMALSVTAPTRATPGLPITYTLTYTNPVLGPPLANDVVITATLDLKSLTFANANQGARFRPQDGTVVLSGDTARAGLSRSFQIDAIVAPDARPGQAVLLRAVMSAREEPPLPDVVGTSIVVAPGIPTSATPVDLPALLTAWIRR